MANHGSFCFHEIGYIIDDGSVLVLFQGVGPTAQRAAVIAGVELPVYDWCKGKIITTGFLGDNAYTHFWYVT